MAPRIGFKMALLTVCLLGIVTGQDGGNDGNGGQRTTTSAGSELELRTCNDAVADVVFILDSSGSVQLTNFKKMLDFIRGIVTMFNVGLENIRVGLVRFNSGVVPEFNLNQYTHSESLLEALALVQYTMGTTNMAAAFRYVREHSFLAENGGRTLARKVAVLISDGRSDNRVWTVNEAEECKKSNVTIFALGIGNKVDRDELQDVGSDPDSVHVIFFDDFDALNGTQITIANTVCTYAKLKPPSPYVPPPVVATQAPPMDGGIIAAIIFGVLILIAIILSYPGYVLAKRYVYAGKFRTKVPDLKKKKRPKTGKRPTTARPKTGKRPGSSGRPRSGRPSSGSSRPRSAHRSDSSSQVISETSSVTSAGASAHRGTAHTHTPLRPGTSGAPRQLQRKDSYGSFDAGASDKTPLRPRSISSSTDDSSSLRSGGQPLPPGLERAISMMRRQKTLTQHPAPSGMSAPPPNMMPPPPPGAPGAAPLGPGGAMFARSVTSLMRAPTSGTAGPGMPRAPPPMGLQRENTAMMMPPGGGPPKPSVMVRGPPPPGILRRDGTIVRGPPPPPPGMMMRQGTMMAPPMGGMPQRQGTMMAQQGGGGGMIPPPPAITRQRTSMMSPAAPPPQPPNNPFNTQAIIEEEPSPTAAPPPLSKPGRPLGALPSLAGSSKLPPLIKPQEPSDEGTVDPQELATRLRNLDSVPTVVRKGGQGASIAEETV